MQKIWIILPPKNYLILLIIPLVLFLSVIFSGANLYLTGIFILSLGLIFYRFFQSFRQVDVSCNQIKNCLKSREKVEKISVLIEEGIQKSDQSREIKTLKQKLKEAQKAEKKAKSELLGFNQELSQLNYRIYELESNNQVQKMRIAGLEGENKLLEKIVGELREEKSEKLDWKRSQG